MIRASGKHGGFTLVELLVVVGMVALITGAMATAVTSAQERARFQKAKNDVKVISQAIRAYEEFAPSGQLQEMVDQEANADNLKFLLGEGQTRSGQKLPTLLEAAFKGGGKIVDPWGKPYLVCIRKREVNIDYNLSRQSYIGICLPNFNRVSESERAVIWKDEKTK